MADSYDAVAYLLDRANIHDTVAKLGACVDGGSWASVPDEVFAADLRIDYTEVFPGEPYVTTGAKQVAEWAGMLKLADKSQHVLR